MKIIEFNVGALAEEGKSFESCINLMEQVHQEMSIAISELSVSYHSDVLVSKNELIRIQREAEALKTKLRNLKNVLSYAGDLYWNTELDYQKRINGEWAVVDKPFYESKGFKFVAGAAIAIGTGVACVVFSVPAIVVGIGVAVGVGVCAFTVYTAHKLGTELDTALADGVFKGTKETALLIGTGVFAGKVVQLGMKTSLIQNVGTKLSQISALNNPFFKCLALDKMEDMIADGADDLLRGAPISVSLINPLIKELSKGNLDITPGKAVGLFQLLLTGKRSQLDNVEFGSTSSQMDQVLHEGLETGDLNRLDEALDMNLHRVDDGVEGARNKTYQYNMIENPGPLAYIQGQPAKNFFSGKYNVEVLKEDKIYYRAGQEGKPLGQWFTSEPAETAVKVRIDTAVKPQWIDPISGELTGISLIDTNYAIKIPAGTTVYTGPVGNQGGIYLGGNEMMQTFIETPWKLKNIEVISQTTLK